MKVSNRLEEVKKYTLSMVADIFELARFSNGLDINIHFEIDEAPRITYTIIDEIIREKEPDSKELLKGLENILKHEEMR